MSVTFGFFDSVDGDRKYSADDFTRFLGNLISDGVIASPSNGLQVQATEGMTVKVTAGWAYIQGHYVHNDTDLYLTLDEPDIVQYRADRIVLRFDRINRKIDIAVKNGTVSEYQSVVPALQRDENIWELSLAWIWTGAGMEALEQQHIHDERGQTDVCGWVTGMIQQIDTTNLFAQYDNAFWTWFNGIKRDYDSTYVCNGVDDNVKLPLFIQQVQQRRPNINTIAIMGTFGIDDTTEDTGSYSTIVSLWIDNSENKPITLDFSRCDEIQFTKSNDFALFQNCTIKSLKLAVNCELDRGESGYLNTCIQTEKVTLENCSISGTLTGEIRLFYQVIRMLDETDCCKNCNVDIAFADNQIVGIFTSSKNHIKDTNIKVTGKSATGIYAISSYLSNCTVSALANENGEGISISSDCFASNCDITGYTKNTADYHGCGIYSSGTVKVYLNGIRSVADTPPLYGCTNSMRLAGGSEGFFTGIFSPVVYIPDTVATNQPIKMVTQAEYDSMENPSEAVIYVITDGGDSSISSVSNEQFSELLDTIGTLSKI